MTIAVVFDSAGTLLRTYRVVKEVVPQTIHLDVETTMLTYSSALRVLVVLHVHSRDIMEAPPELLLSGYLIDNKIGFGIACARKVVTMEEVEGVLFRDKYTVVGDMQDCIRAVWTHCRRESVVMMDSGAIVNFEMGGIEFTVTSGGRPFKGAKEAIHTLHSMGVATYVASGDRGEKLERIAEHLGIPIDRVYGTATPHIKAQIVEDLKREYDAVVMVGDGINDMPAMEKADIAILSEQQ
ncbi:MAG TPA: HAD-IC family P-type ATPase, partial [Methanomicrobiales archaeon]|nr:HAD-IC family P-type ATPase [Methanomicrobiales archaeon]